MFALTSACVRRFVSSLGEGEMFTTRQCIALAESRAALDNSLSRLARAGITVRVAYGVYMKAYSREGGHMPTTEDIAKVKNESLKRQVVPSPINNKFASEVPQAYGESLDQVGEQDSTELMPKPLQLDTTSSTSQFRCFNGQTVKLRRVSSRKLQLSFNPVGEKIRLLWEAKVRLVEKQVQSFITKLFRQERGTVLQLIELAPAWLSDELVPRLPKKWPFADSKKRPQRRMVLPSPP